MKAVVLLSLLAFALASRVEQQWAAPSRSPAEHMAKRGYIVASEIMASHALAPMAAGDVPCTAAGFDAALTTLVNSIEQFTSADNPDQLQTAFSGLQNFTMTPVVAACMDLAGSMFQIGPVAVTVLNTRACIFDPADRLTYPTNDPCCPVQPPATPGPSMCCLPRDVTRVAKAGLQSIKLPMAQSMCMRPTFIAAMWPAIYRYMMRAEHTCALPVERAIVSLGNLVNAMFPCFLSVMNPFMPCTANSACLSGVCGTIGASRFCQLPALNSRAQVMATCIVTQVTDLEAVFNLKVSLGLNIDATFAQVAAALTTQISTPNMCLDPSTNKPAPVGFQTSQGTCEAEKFCSHHGDGTGPSGPTVTDTSCQNELPISAGKFCALAMPLGFGFFNLQKTTAAACPAGVCFSDVSVTDMNTCTGTSYCTTSSTPITDVTACAATGYCQGNWAATTKSQCEGDLYCMGEIGIVRDDMSAAECTKCSGTMTPKYTWIPGQLAPGIWAPINFISSTAVQKYIFGNFLDFDKFGIWVNRVVARFLADVFKSVLACTFLPLLRGLQETSHACTADGKANPAFKDAPKDVKFNVAKILFYKGLQKRASVGSGSSVAVDKNGIVSANGQVSCDLDVSTGGDLSSATGRHLLQSGGNVYDKAGTSIVGQTVGNGVAVSLSGGSATYRLCLEIDQSASTPGKTSPGIAMSDANGKLLNQEGQVDVEAGKYCGTFSQAGTYYPMRFGAKPAAASFLVPSLLVVLLALLVL